MEQIDYLIKEDEWRCEDDKKDKFTDDRYDNYDN